MYSGVKVGLIPSIPAAIFLIFSISIISLGNVPLPKTLIGVGASINRPFCSSLAIFLISSIFVRYAIYLFLSTTAFWWVSNDGLKSIFWEVSQLGNYPISIYPQWLKAVLMIIPFSFIGYFPVHELLLSTNRFTLETLMNVSSGWIIFYLVYQFFWKQGLKKYQSIGG